MFRILLIVGLLLAGVQQSLARGNVDLTDTGSEIIQLLSEADVTAGALETSEEPVKADTTPSYCKSSDCKAVIGSAYLGSFKTRESPDIVRPIRRSSIAPRLEPRPPNT